MSTSTITFYPVDNGGMSLVKLNDSKDTTILIDMHIRSAADNDNEDAFDVAKDLRKQIKTDDKKRPFVDVLLLTHNDDDHVKGLQNHFYLGDIADYKMPEEDDDEEPLIIIKEMWSSYRFWKRASNSNKLCDDAKAFNREMKRRVTLFEEKEKIQNEGNRALIIGKDPDGKTDKILEIVREIDSIFTKVNNRELSEKLSIRVLGPIPQQEDEKDDDYNKKNRGSVILQLTVIENEYENKIFSTGDAGVFVWDCLWDKHKKSKSKLEYDILMAPHHCSWRSLSHDSYSESDDPKVSTNAKNALSQKKEGAYIISSSKPIKDDDNDPPSHAAKKEYEAFVTKKHFLCTAEEPSEKKPKPIVFNLTKSGPQRKSSKAKSKQNIAAESSTQKVWTHG